MAAVAEGLLKTLSAAAPSVDFVMYFGMLNFDGSCNWWHWSNGFIGAFAIEFLFDIFEYFEVEMRYVLFFVAFGGVGGAYDPGFGRYIFYFFEEVS